MRWEGKHGAVSLWLVIDMSCSTSGTPYMTCKLNTESVCLVRYVGVHDRADMGVRDQSG